MTKFTPTHRITRPDGRSIDVMLCDGAAYTADEWTSATTADYERDDAGQWTFQGEAFTGEIEPV